MAELMDEFQREKDCFSKAVNYQVEERWIYMEKLDCENSSHKKWEMIEPINLNFMYILEEILLLQYDMIAVEGWIFDCNWPKKLTTL